MKKLQLCQMEDINGGTLIPKWLECAGAVVTTGLFFGAIFITSGPIGVYVANAVLGPTIVGLSWAACAD